MTTKSGAQESLKRLVEDIPLGVYNHYKGGEYILYSTSVHESELVAMCHYYSIERKSRWTRTLENFTEWLDVEDYRRPRFQYEREATLLEMCDASGMIAIASGIRI